MGTEARYTATITKKCDGCGVSWEGTARFSSISALLAYGGPVEAANWQIRMHATGASLLCDLCVEHEGNKP